MATLLSVNFDNHTNGTYTVARLAADFSPYDTEIGVDEGRVDVVDMGAGKGIRVTHPANEYGIGTDAGVMFYSRFAGQDEALLTYDVRFNSAFDTVLSGKLPGLASGAVPPSGGNQANGTNGYSARLNFRAAEHGSTSLYVGLSLYLYDMSATPARAHAFSVDVERDKISTIKQYVKMNGSGQSDGIVRCWVDDVLACEVTGLQFVTNGDKTDNIFFSNFYGGDDASYAPSAAMHIDYDNFSVVTADEFSVVGLSGGATTVFHGETGVGVECVNAGAAEGTINYGGIAQTVAVWPAVASGVSTIELGAIDATGLSIGPHDLDVVQPAPNIEFEVTMGAGETFIVGAGNLGTYDAYIDWGDASGISNRIIAYDQTADLTHDYTVAGAGTYLVSISGDFPWLFMNNSASAAKITRFLNVGDTGLLRCNAMLWGATNLTEFTSRDTNLTGVDAAYSMLRGLTSMVSPPDLSTFDMPLLTNPSYMLKDLATATSPPDLSWITPASSAKFTTLADMLDGWVSMPEIDLPIDTWNVEKVTTFVNFCRKTKLTTACYNRVLIAWAAQNLIATTNMDFSLCTWSGVDAGAARDVINGKITGIIIDAGEAP